MFQLRNTLGMGKVSPSLSASLDKFEFTCVKILLVIFCIKNFVKQELFGSNANKMKKLERWVHLS